MPRAVSSRQSVTWAGRWFGRCAQYRNNGILKLLKFAIRGPHRLPGRRPDPDSGVVRLADVYEVFMNSVTSRVLTPLLRRGSYLAIFAAAFLISVAAGPRLHANQQALYLPNLVVVTYHDGETAAQRQAAAQLGLEKDNHLRSPYFTRYKITPAAQAAGVTVPNAVAAMLRLPGVRSAEPDYLAYATLIPNDPRFSEQYGLHNTGQNGGTIGADIKASEAWDTITGSDQLIMAVTDTGTDYTHPDLTANILRNGANQVIGYDFINDDNDPIDDEGHGTHVSGIMAARGNNAVGVSGVCHVAKIMPIKVLDSGGSGSFAAIAAGFDFASQRNVKILNASLGGPVDAQVLRDAVQRSRAAGVLIFAAAGNDAEDNDLVDSYPCDYSTEFDNVVSVAATNNLDDLASFSNFGATSVNIGAPGEQILSTLPNNAYALEDGTSMASPMAAGAAGLIYAQDLTNQTYLDVKNRLYNTVDVLPSLTGRCTTGGRVNLQRAMRLVQVLEPNGGEIYQVGDLIPITWTTQGYPANRRVRISLSRNGGVSFSEVLATNLTDTGVFNWTSTGPTSDLCRIRVELTNIGNLTGSDVSDSNFRVVQGSIQVVSPNGSEVFRFGERVTVEWDTAGFAGASQTARIDLSRDGGVSYETVVPSALNSVGSNTATFVARGPATIEARVRVTAVSLPFFNDESDVDFEIREQSRITVQSPNGGEMFVVGETLPVNWSSAGFTGPVKIEVSRNGGGTYETIFANTADDGSEAWTVTGPITANARIRVSSVDEPGVKDVSNGLFRIEVPSITITAPSPSQTTLIGTTESVTWTTTGIRADDLIQVELSRDGGDNFEVLTQTPNLGQTSWLVEGPETTDALLRLTDLTSGAQTVSQAFFIREPNLFVVNPVANTRWRQGKQEMIEWSGTTVGANLPGNRVDIQISKDGGRTFSNLISGTANDGAQAIGVNGKTSARVKIRIVWTMDPAVQADSQTFSIVAPKKKKGR